LSLMATSIVALSRVGSTCLFAKVRVSSTNHSKRRSFIELVFTGAKLEVEPAGVGDCLTDLGATVVNVVTGFRLQYSATDMIRCKNQRLGRLI
jgi:hypothetical protein